ncbi:MAG: glycosyltransferase family 2 protein [Pseudomonadota bacterium]|nr:glycosyltransferase family 2 protein [Pseudomonadota bacterium]
MERSRIAIIVPALNEAATIAAVVARIGEHGMPIVVDDGSTDATATLARAAGADVVTHAATQGYDGALNSGFARAAQLGCAYLITMDADGQHDPAQLPEMIGYLDAGYEMVLGRRDRLQRLGEWLFARCASRLWSMSDPLCGMKGYTIEVYRRAGCFDVLRSIGSELAVRSKRDGVRTIEMPILTRRRAGAPRFGHSLAANYKIIRALVMLARVYGARKRQE